ncbi:hypothetical protein DM01DRAFT_1338176 [Hesseltinella vesiculosa]|uniref:Uncharacterized protein n=1 Tax=Hesseltinella vesiculosa TaxID=101127 RepID=A0A1X2GB17_9FUNG|nr:hypothetical protein DM01DRAFT_1338176 [Hesseltinella vesiculosa]
MDVVIAQTVNQFYSLLYNQALAFNITLLPTPAAVATSLTAAGATIYQLCPDGIQLYYDKFVSLPVQSNIIPVFLALVVLYILFSIIMATVRGIFRLVYNFVRFSIIALMIILCLYVGQQYMDQGMPALYGMFDSFVQVSKKAPSLVLQQPQQ